MKQQIWFCLACHTCGVVLHQEGMGAYDVIMKIRADHDEQSRERSKSPLRPDGVVCNVSPQVVR